MMAELIDSVEQNEDDFSVLTESNDQEVAVEEERQPEVPDKYRNKSIQDLVKMHQEAESRIGQQGSEVGELRKVVDQFILSRSDEKKAEPVEEVDFFADPDKAVDKRINSHPAIKQAQELNARMRSEQAKSALMSKHPDAAEIAGDPSFVEWVQSSKWRKELYSRADSQFDTDAADELFSQWKSTKSASSSVLDAEKATRKDTLRKASTGSSKGSSEPKGKTFYRRRDIIELIQTNPERYHAMEPEIRLAYAEGRVR
jgi:hypothetical protein